MRHAGFREQLILAKHGVPWHVASSWSPARRVAALQILQGHEDAMLERWPQAFGVRR